MLFCSVLNVANRKTELLFTKGVEDDELATQDTGGAIPLPDIKQTLRKKEMEEEIARMAEEKEEKKVRIKRTDKEAFRKVRKIRLSCRA
jgi:hypothetical protein